MPNVSPDQRRVVASRIRRELRNEPDISQRQLLARLRASGTRIANQAGRELIELERAGLRRQRQPSVPGLFTEAELRQRTARGRTPEAVLRQSLAARGTPTRQGVREVTHVAVTWQATGLAIISDAGTPVAQHRFTLNGRYVGEIRQATAELVRERIIQSLEGQLLNAYAGSQGIQGDPYDLDVDIRQLRITTQLEGRGR